MFLFYIIFSWLIADVITGVIHWVQDHYFVDDSKYKIVAAISKDNGLHHSKPEAMGHLSIWENINTSAPYGWAASAILFFIGTSPLVWLSVFFASFGNLVHRFAHIPRNKVPAVIKWLQITGLFISAKHHNQHHRKTTLSDCQKPIHSLIAKEDSNTKFCPMTNWMNPILDTVKFFSLLELLLSFIDIKTIEKKH